MGRPLSYGQVAGPQSYVNGFVGASEIFWNLSGHFMSPDGSGNLEIANATDVNIVGWMEHGEATASATEGTAGGEVAGVNVAKDAVYEIRAVGTAGAAVTEATLKAAVWETCDIQMVSTSYQCASLVASAIDILLIVDYRFYGTAAGQQSVLVMINWEKVVNTGVA